MDNAGDLNVKPDWKGSLKKVWTSEEGSVSFVQFEQGNTLVVKGSSTVVQETYAASVIISTGLPSARIRVVNSRDSEWREIKSALNNYCFRSTTDEINRTRVKSLLAGPLNRAQLMIIEYVKGVSFDMLYGEKLERFTADVTKVRKNCRICGQLLAIDLFLQNSDRIPTSVWQNEGNAGNLMVNTKNEIFAIDSLVTTLDPDKNETSFKYYTAKEKNLSNFFKELTSIYHATSLDVKNSQILSKFGKFFSSCTRFDLDSQCYREYIEGIIDGIKRVVELIKMDYFVSLHEHMKKMFSVTWMNIWENDLKLIHLNFFSRVSPLFEEFVASLKKADPSNIELNLFFPLSKTTSSMKPKKVISTGEGVKSVFERPKINANMLKLKAPRQQKKLKRPPILFKATDLSGIKTGLKKSMSPAKSIPGKIKGGIKIAEPPGEALRKSIEMKNALDTDFLKRYTASSSKIFRMNRDSTIESAIRNFCLDDCDMFFFDFDQTLTMPQKVKKMGMKAKLRGGTEAYNVINKLWGAGKDMFIVTANPPTKIAASSVASEVQHLGLDDIFHCSSLDVQSGMSRLNTNNFNDSFEDILGRLLLSFCLLSPRFGVDLYRIAATSIGITENQVSFQLFKESHSGLDFEQLSSVQTIESKEVSDLVSIYSKMVENESTSKNACFFKRDDSSKEPLSQGEILAIIQKFAENLAFTVRDIHRLCFGESVEFNTSEIENIPETLKNIKLGTNGNLICSKYNKSDAIEIVIRELHAEEQSNKKVQFYFKDKEALKKKDSLKIAFFDDNASNVFSVYSAFATKNNVRVNGVWYEPPLIGSNELKQHDPIEKWVRDASLLSTVGVTEVGSFVGKHNILVLQFGPMSISSLVQLLAVEIKEVDDIKLVILPEGIINDHVEYSENNENIQSMFKELCQLAIELKVDIIPGTFREVCPDRKYYTTTIYIESTGRILSVYRKQRIHNFATQAVGSEIVIFDTKFGKTSLLICLDIEDETLLKEVIKQGAETIFNPVHIPSTKALPEEEDQQWRYKLQMMGKYLEKICWDSNATVVRCDMPVPFGSGTSQVITPTFTETIASLRKAKFVFDLSDHDNRLFFDRVPEGSYERTDDKDNNGFRIVAQNLKISPALDKKTCIKEIFGDASLGLHGPQILLLGMNSSIYLNPMNFKRVTLEDSSQLLNQFGPNLNKNCIELDSTNMLYLSKGCLIFAELCTLNRLRTKHILRLSYPILNFVLDIKAQKIYCMGINQISILTFGHNRTYSKLVDYIRQE